MKKNLLTVLILALLLVNLILTGVMAFSVMGTNKKTAELIGNIATVLNFELSTPGEEEKEAAVSLADTEVKDLTGAMTIPLVSDGSGKQSYIVFEVVMSINTKHPDYKVYGENLSDRELLIKDAITSVVSKKTEAECADLDLLKADILKAIQDLFDSDFIYSIGLNGIKYG